MSVAQRPTGAVIPATARTHPALVPVGLALLAAGVLLGILGHGLDATTTGELRVLQAFQSIRNPVLTFIARALELLGGPKVVPWFLLVVAAVLAVTRRFVMALIAVLMPGLGWLPGHIAKLLLPRQRPPASLEPVVVYHDIASFPSGHTGFAHSITIFVLFALTMWGLRRRWMVWVGVAVVVLMALSRMYAAAHYPMDVLGGALLAAGTALVLWSPAAWAWGRAQASDSWLTEPQLRTSTRPELERPSSGLDIRA